MARSRSLPSCASSAGTLGLRSSEATAAPNPASESMSATAYQTASRQRMVPI
jgi:hypothetical protein